MRLPATPVVSHVVTKAPVSGACACACGSGSSTACPGAPARTGQSQAGAKSAGDAAPGRPGSSTSAPAATTSTTNTASGQLDGRLQNPTRPTVTVAKP